MERKKNANKRRTQPNRKSRLFQVKIKCKKYTKAKTQKIILFA